MKRLGAGESRPATAAASSRTEETWIGIVPVGYADGFRRDLTGTEVLVGGARCRVVGTVSMDAVAVRLPDRAERGTPVTLVGDGIDARATCAASRTRSATSSPAASARVRAASVREARGWVTSSRAASGAPGRPARRARGARSDGCSPRSRATSARSTSAAGRARSRTRWRRSSARSSGSTSRRSYVAAAPGRRCLRTARSSPTTRRRCRSRTATSTSSVAFASCTTRTGPSSSSRSSPA